MPCADLLPEICLPFDTTALKKLLSAMKVALKQNFISSLLLLGGYLMSLHYSTFNSTRASRCPIVVAIGVSETGKSTSINAALAICGERTRYIYFT